MEKIKKNKILWTKKDLLGLAELSPEEIELILETAVSFKEISERTIKKVPALRGKTIAHLFLEPSTRTRVSFELAAKRLSADTIGISGGGSSILKGETMKDTAKNIEAMKVDMIILRHSCAGAPHQLARNLRAGVLNAGDGCHEHPTQALLDMFTIKEKLGNIKGKKISIIGDITHSRVARSNIIGLTKLGAEVTICAPKTLIPVGVEKMGCKATYSLEKALRSAEVINVLRLQKERQTRGLLPTIREYIKEYGVTLQKVNKLCDKNIVIMHPGPINRGIEMTQEVADSKNSVILEQVTNGIAIRMAVMFLLSQYKGS